MYLSYFGLKEKPFKISSDPKFLWLSDKHKEALATLTYGVLDNKGFLLLTGDVGTGKTTLINTLINNITDQAIVAVIPDPGLSKLEFYNYLAHEFNLKGKFSDKATFLFHFRHFLHEATLQNKKVLLIIDEAQRLDHELLEDIRLLSNIEHQQVKLLNIFLIGQNDFNDTLLKIENRAIRQRISLNYHINPLQATETELYVRHRLKMAGAFQDIFGQDAYNEIHYYTKGFPRLINILCDHALLTGYVREMKVIGPDVIRECVKELRITPAKMDYTPESSAKELKSAPSDINPQTKAGKKAKHHIEKPHSSLPKTSLPGKQYKKFLIIILISSIFLGLMLFQKDSTKIKESITAYFRDVYTNLQSEASPGDPTQAMSVPNETKAPPPITRVIPVETMEPKRPLPMEDPSITTASTEKKSLKGVREPESSKEFRPFIQHVTDERKTPPDDQKASKPKDQAFYDSAMAGHWIPFPFIRNSNDLSNDSYQKLAILTDILTQFPETKVDIKGYSDATGTDQYNKNLSQFRANIIKSYFLGHGIGEDRITSTGMGGANPLKSNETIEGRKANRRVEIKLLFSDGRKDLQKP